MNQPLPVLVVAGLLLAGCGGVEGERQAAAPHDEAHPAPAATEAAMAPLPKARPKLVTPQAGQSSTVSDVDPGAGTVSDDDTSLPKPTSPASSTEEGAGGSSTPENLSADTAIALPNGIAVPPLEAPEAVLNVIRAGNIIARSPYKWGGGHGRFQDNGYDCSGSVSYALYYAGLVGRSYVSGEYMAYGKPGPGKWITIYANPGHMYMEVAGVRFDTSGARETGSRWQNATYGNRDGDYEVRHPPGL